MLSRSRPALCMPLRGPTEEAPWALARLHTWLHTSTCAWMRPICCSNSLCLRSSLCTLSRSFPWSGPWIKAAWRGAGHYRPGLGSSSGLITQGPQWLGFCAEGAQPDALPRALSGLGQGAGPDQRSLPSVQEDDSQRNLGLESLHLCGASTDTVSFDSPFRGTEPGQTPRPGRLRQEPKEEEEHSARALCRPGPGHCLCHRQCHRGFSGCTPPLHFRPCQWLAHISLWSLHNPGQTSCGAGLVQGQGKNRVLWPLDPQCCRGQKGSGGLASKPATGALMEPLVDPLTDPLWDLPPCTPAAEKWVRGGPWETPAPSLPWPMGCHCSLTAYFLPNPLSDVI